MRVKWLQKAMKNLDEEITYIALDDTETACKIYQYIKTKVSDLKNHHNIGRSGRIFGTRELVIDRYPYIIPYRVHNDVIEILRVFHTSRKPPRKW